MSFRQCINALETLTPYHELINYLKRDDQQQKSAELDKQLDAVLNEDQIHSGASWHYLLSVLRGVYKGNITHTELVDEMNKEEERCRLYREKNQPLSGDDLYFQDRSRLC